MQCLPDDGCHANAALLDGNFIGFGSHSEKDEGKSEKEDDAEAGNHDDNGGVESRTFCFSRLSIHFIAI
jgi:hypothetical protein